MMLTLTGQQTEENFNSNVSDEAPYVQIIFGKKTTN